MPVAPEGHVSCTFLSPAGCPSLVQHKLGTSAPANIPDWTRPGLRAVQICFVFSAAHYARSTNLEPLNIPFKGSAWENYLLHDFSAVVIQTPVPPKPQGRLAGLQRMGPPLLPPHSSSCLDLREDSKQAPTSLEDKLNNS